MKTPLLVKPIAKRRVWGGKSLVEKFAGTVETPIGESWEIFDFPGVSSLILNGKHEKRSLHDLFLEDPAELCGVDALVSDIGRLPLVLKLVETSGFMSLLVHPGDEEARRRYGPQAIGGSKAWYVLDADPGACVYHGLIGSLGAAELRKILPVASPEDILNRLPVKRGDYIAIPSGTPHSIAGRVVLAEISQSSNIFYRLSDWGRKPSSELHVDEGLAVANLKGGRPAVVGPAMGLSDDKDRCLLRADRFTMSRLVLGEGEKREVVTLKKSFQMVLVAEGGLRVEAGGEWIELGRWRSCLIPAGAGEFELVGATKKNSVVLLYTA